jgi:hypothetical protein
MNNAQNPDGPSAASGNASAGLSSSPTEASLIGRFVAILTPLFAIAAGWIAGAIAQIVPGAHLDQSQIVTFMAAAAAAALAAGWKWLQGWQQHEALVANGLDTPVKRGDSPLVAARGTTSGTTPAAPGTPATPAAPGPAAPGGAAEHA